MSNRYVLILIGVILMAIGVVEGGWTLLAIWLGADFAAVGIAHVVGFHRIFGKRVDGSLPFWSWVLFLPWLILTHVVWRGIFWLSGEAAENAVTDDFVVGRRLLPHEVKGEFDNYVDLTSEFAEPLAIRQRPGYRCFPILDGSAPEPEELRQFLGGLPPGRTFVHCAQGHGRAGLFSLAWMLQSGRVKTIEEGLEKLRAIRPWIQLNGVQRQCAERLVEGMRRMNDE
jgi:hypothetical protein